MVTASILQLLNSANAVSRQQTLPSERPPCQYFYRERNAATSGTITTNDPVTIRFQTCSPRAPALE